LNRLLSLIAWVHQAPIVKEDGVGGPRRAVPHIWAPRSNFGLLVEPRYLLAPSDNYSADRWLALALYKEGLNSKSVFYSLFSFWKMIEVAIVNKDVRWGWINSMAPLLMIARDRITKIASEHDNVAEYLDYSCRCAIAHVFREPVINPDDYADYVRISQDVHVVEELARRAVDEHLPSRVDV